MFQFYNLYFTLIKWKSILYIDFNNTKQRLFLSKNYWTNLCIDLVSWHINYLVDTLWGCLFYKGLECERPSRVAWWTLFTHMTATLILSWEWELKRRRESRADRIWGKGGLGTAGGMCSLFPHFCWYRKESKNRQYMLSECPPHFWTFRRPWIVVDGSRMGGRKSVLNTTCWKI